jgi:hypothetical protein
MAEKTEREHVRELPPISELGSANAPMLYFEEASAFGHINGIIRLTLEAARMYPATPDPGVKIDRVIVAHLRMNIPAARSLKKALEGALLMATPLESEAKN